MLLIGSAFGPHSRLTNYWLMAQTSGREQDRSAFSAAQSHFLRVSTLPRICEQLNLDEDHTLDEDA